MFHHAAVLLLILARPTFHHFFHKGCEHMIHLGVHKVGALKFIAKKFAFAPDVTMIGILLLLEFAVEMLTKE
jgi:hypothetical protein